MNTSTEEYRIKMNKEQERIDRDRPQMHTIESFNKMMKESQEKWNNVNDKFIEACTKPKHECYSCGGSVEDINTCNKITTWDGYDNIDVPLCNGCANEMARDLGGENENYEDNN